MINLAAAIKKRRLTIADRNSSNSSSNVVIQTEQRCFFDGYDLVLFNILSRLPVESLTKFKSVCKRWRCLIKHDKYFENLHFTSRLRDENTFLIYPTCRIRATIPIKRFLLCQKDLSFDDSQGRGSSDTAAVFGTSNNVTLAENQSISMLEPVRGLVCFVKGAGHQHYSSVLIYNPSTREKTPWIETSTSAVFRNIHGVPPEKDCQGRPLSRKITFNYRYMFGFGIDPTTNQHKVLCMYKSTLTRLREVDIFESVCGVLTLGENTWRKIDQVPPETAIGKRCVHVRGSLYWMSGSQNGVLMVFDLGSETLRLIATPNFILGLWSPIPLVHRLAEVDGHLAILDKEGDEMLNLWIYNADNGSNGNWVKETMQLPCRWDAIHNLAFKCIADTSLVIIKVSREARERHEFRCEHLHCYNRREKKYYRNQFSVFLEPTGEFGDTYSIAPFVGTLLPV